MASPQRGGTVVSAFIAVLCTTLSHYLSTRQSELYSEVICWATLPVLFRFGKRFEPSFPAKESFQAKNFAIHQGFPTASQQGSVSSQPSGPLWVITLGVTVVTIYKTEVPSIELYPLLTPLFWSFQTIYAPIRPKLEASEPGILSTIHDTLFGTTLVAVFSVVALPNCTLDRVVLSIVPTFALLLIYVSLSPTDKRGKRLIPSVAFEDAVEPISQRIVPTLLGVLGVQILVFGFPRSQLIPTVALGIVKATSWYFVSRVASSSSWRAATSIGTFSMLATADPLAYDSDFRALSYIIASLLAIAQVIGMLPKTAVLKPCLWIFASMPLISYLATRSAIINAETLAQGFEKSGRLHPVESLILDAKTDFESLLNKQSKTFGAACSEYRRRYGIDPPPGFEAWYEFAVSHQSPIIDDFDTIHASVSPFWKLDGQSVARLMQEAQDVQGSELWQCSFSGRSSQTACEHPHRDYDRHVSFLFNKLMGELQGALPDVDFLVNHFDEPALLIPPPRADSGESLEQESFQMTYMSKRPTWQTITKFCAPRHHLHDGAPQHALDVSSLPFVTNLTSAIDLCQHAEYSGLHGFLRSPTSFRLIEGRVPLLSAGVPSVMGDIVFPSPAYLEEEFQYDESRDVDWEHNRNELYWAGATTGGFAQDEHWREFHRQRFVTMAQNLDRGHTYSHLDGGKESVKRVDSSFLNRRRFNVAFTKFVGCDLSHCRDQRAYYNFESVADKDQALRSRLAFDMDGNGISGRYYKLLASRSTPLKLTVFREWHDDRLVPWYHYIPVSLGMEELPELVMYLTSTESGKRRAREIAENGRDWYSKAFREVDMTIYLYRLLLELARLQDPGRKAS
ncbi:hypothetical protein NLU13_3885 [Sarocladium strictum]|uniref:Glycosyl transferase CAP10 domain-containing protein n=1 Tax=Sarocladium strictum TaxID=5046 RepID=A0AA39GHV1_SARSR|nr:hypothetical protein NLU13_3885 [Sarocladium strictum]